jgi:hypothetical protein
MKIKLQLNPSKDTLNYIQTIVGHMSIPQLIPKPNGFPSLRDRGLGLSTQIPWARSSTVIIPRENVTTARRTTLDGGQQKSLHVKWRHLTMGRLVGSPKMIMLIQSLCISQGKLYRLPSVPSPFPASHVENHTTFQKTKLQRSWKTSLGFWF